MIVLYITLEMLYMFFVLQKNPYPEELGNHCSYNSQQMEVSTNTVLYIFM